MVWALQAGTYIASVIPPVRRALDCSDYHDIVSNKPTVWRTVSTSREGGISRQTRGLLETLHRAGPGPYDAAAAAVLWGMGREAAGRRLRMLAERGWVTRARHGLYWPVPLDSSPEDWTDDPWLVAAKLYPSGYVGGWSAAEHWGLTDQLFRDLLVFTPDRSAPRRVTVAATPIRARLVTPAKVFGTRTSWRKSVRVAVSDPSRTIADLLSDPSAGGGIRHVAEILDSYLHSPERDTDLLVTYLDRLGNGSAFKRLGYLLELASMADAALLGACRERMTKGVSNLDPAAPARGPVVTRWNLRVNVELDR